MYGLSCAGRSRSCPASIGDPSLVGYPNQVPVERDNFVDASEEWIDVVDALLELDFGEEERGGDRRIRHGQESAIPQEEEVDFIKQDFRAWKRSRIEILRRAWGPKQILMKDKMAFLLGTTQLWACSFWLGWNPQSFHKLYSGLGLLLFIIRFVVYKSRRQHYYLFDFCYWANLLLLVQLWWCPNYEWLKKVSFSFTTGPLAWSVLAFRNSLVFHDLDKVTSLYFHLMPALVTWALRWFPADASVSTNTTNYQSMPDQCPWIETDERSQSCPDMVVVTVAPPPLWISLWLIPLAIYILWCTLYYLKIFVFSASVIEQRGYKTLYEYVRSRKKGLFYEIARRIPGPWQPVAYLLCHLIFCSTTLASAIPCHTSFALHTGILIGVASASIWSGASYYFEVFHHNYSQARGMHMKTNQHGEHPDMPPLSRRHSSTGS